MIFATTRALPIPQQADRDGIAHMPKTIAAHDASRGGHSRRE